MAERFYASKYIDAVENSFNSLNEEVNKINSNLKEFDEKYEDLKLDVYGIKKEDETTYQELAEIKNNIEVLVEDNTKQWIAISSLKKHIAETEYKYDNVIKGGYKVFYILLIIDALMIIGHFLIP